MMNSTKRKKQGTPHNADQKPAATATVAPEPKKAQPNPLETLPHVDDFIDTCFGGSMETRYARFVLNYFRMPEAIKSDFAPWMKQFALFCTYKGNRYRVTGASRLGDIWLAEDHSREIGYDHRVVYTDCSDWGAQA